MSLSNLLLLLIILTLSLFTFLFETYHVMPSRFSRVRLCATPWTAARQAPLSTGFSRQEHWSGLPFPSPKHVIHTENYKYTMERTQ